VYSSGRYQPTDLLTDRLTAVIHCGRRVKHVKRLTPSRQQNLYFLNIYSMGCGWGVPDCNLPPSSPRCAPDVSICIRCKLTANNLCSSLAMTTLKLLDTFWSNLALPVPGLQPATLTLGFRLTLRVAHSAGLPTQRLNCGNSVIIKCSMSTGSSANVTNTNLTI
jgi:hypothetical protein